MESTKYGHTNRFLTKDGRPFFPVAGEFHYSRYPQQFWEESLLKMKAGGVDIVSSYCIWIHHEEHRGTYDFTGNRDLRKFVSLVGKCGMKMILRLGPWSHAEARYGGYPGWLACGGFALRENNDEYFALVREFYEKIYEQVCGLFLKDGGPIIGIQIENELGHSGPGVKGDDAAKHMRILTKMIKEIGFDVPYYTATGWGGAQIGDCLPVMGGYCEAPWEKTTEKLPPNTNFVITHERDDHKIGRGRVPGEGAGYSFDDYPYLTAELGGGLQVTYDRRPVASTKDIETVALCKIASGANMLGFYMYHGGRNPKEGLNETKATGSWCDLPVFNYDFAAPIGAYGNVTDTFRGIKLLTMFLKDFGSELCEMETFIPKETPDNAGDLSGLRMSIRIKGAGAYSDAETCSDEEACSDEGACSGAGGKGIPSGYVFVNNYQRSYDMADHDGVVLCVKEAGIKFPQVDIKNGDAFFYPFNFKAGSILIKTATATPLCALSDERGARDTFVFYSDGDPEFDMEERTSDAGSEKDGEEGERPPRILCLSREKALNVWKIKRDREYLIFCRGTLIDFENNAKITGKEGGNLGIFPKPNFKLNDYELTEETDEDGFFVLAPKEAGQKKAGSEAVRFECEPDEAANRRFKFVFNYAEGVSDAFFNVRINADTAKLFVNGEFVDDRFFDGTPWKISLKQFDFPASVEIEASPFTGDENVFLETLPDPERGADVSAEAEDEFETIL